MQPMRLAQRGPFQDSGFQGAPLQTAIPAPQVLPTSEKGKTKPMTPPKHEGFHGKASISLSEAQELSALLDVVLAPVTPQEMEAKLADDKCLRELTDAGGFPIVKRLQDRLKAFIATATPSDTFQISHGELNVTGKAVDCAEALGRLETLKTVATVGGVAAGGAGLLLLLGLI